MHHRPDLARASALIAAAHDRTGVDPDELSAALRRRCWPGGTRDHTEPARRAGVARCATQRLSVVLLECTCAQGHCDLCN